MRVTVRRPGLTTRASEYEVLKDSLDPRGSIQVRADDGREFWVPRAWVVEPSAYK